MKNTHKKFTRTALSMCIASLLSPSIMAEEVKEVEVTEEPKKKRTRKSKK